MSFTPEQFDKEHASFNRSPDWELANIVRALNFFPMLNTSEHEARLAAVKQIQKQRRRNHRG